MSAGRKSRYIRGYILVTFIFQQEEDGRWAAHCKELGTATFGRSLREAQERLKDAVVCHLNTLEEVGERERFLAENHIKFLSVKPRFGTVNIQAPLDGRSYTFPHLQPLPAY